MTLILILTLISFLILAGIWGFFIEPKIVKLEKISLEIKNLPISFRNLKIIHLSDFHCYKFGQKEKKVLEILKKLNPDLIFITGDFVSWETTNFDSCQKFWQELSKNYQGRIFGVYGNHDHRNRKFKLLDTILKEKKIEILNNESRKIERDGEFIHLIGVDDPHLGYDNIEKAMEGAAAKGEPMENNSAKILLAHSPEIFRKVKGKNINLVLVGHTHGGQINILPFSYFALPLKYDKKYKSGLFPAKGGSVSGGKENSTYLYVNRGIGESILPIRINAFPEITLIELK